MITVTQAIKEEIIEFNLFGQSTDDSLVYIVHPDQQ